ncbi:methyltransferase family protein [Ancylobacter aquaticus]|uniref:Methyltransferase family protein n=1 Tax=Ancylobacter aquaticus TaxID=100 RepID=A0A4R1HV43_ANCAQ|nr:methyltransferase domain-containing protein [Ancylobacter aquaticus]TCK23839.1 methyltransferase family protein [Ancylobacter aquaticus]
MDVTFFDDKEEFPGLCPVCKQHGATARLRVEGVRYLGAPLEMAECLHCRTLYASSQSPVVGYDFPGFEENYWLNHVQSGAGISAMLEPLLAVAGGKGGRLLDIGCGFGFVGHFWETSGYGSAVGLETSLYGKIGREKLGTTIYPSYYAATPQIAGEKFDFVYSSEVIEHVPDPAAFIAEISQALSDEGILILTTPCADAVVPGASPPEVIAILSPGLHYFVTREEALRALLHDQGFAHVHIANSGTRLFAWASHVPLPEISSGFTHWEAYYDYLDKLSRNADPHVAGGALYRLVKDAVNRGQLDRASAALDRWVPLARSTYGIDFLAPRAIEQRFLAATGPANDAFPSWLGCGLLFYAHTASQLGGHPRLLADVVRSAIVIMQSEIAKFAQFAREPTHFLPLAKQLLDELDHAELPRPASDVRPQFVRAPTASLRGRTVALLCGYAPDGLPSPALLALCKAIARKGVETHVCLAVQAPVAQLAVAGLEDARTIAFRMNDSYDFGIWAAQLGVLPDVWNAERIIFANDSVILVNDAAFDDLMDAMSRDPSEFIALTDSITPVPHAQSYFFQLRGEALNDWRTRSFWAGLPSALDKQEVIDTCELVLTDLIGKNVNLRRNVIFSLEKTFPNSANDDLPTGNIPHFFWERLLLKGMPFIKAELLHSNPMNVRIDHWRHVVRGVGGNVKLATRHLKELDRTRGVPSLPAPPRRRPVKDMRNFLLGLLLGTARLERMREWNRGRRARRRQRRLAEKD